MQNEIIEIEKAIEDLNKKRLLLLDVADAKNYLSTLSDEVKAHLGLKDDIQVVVKEIPFHEVKIETSHISYRITFSINSGKMEAKFYFTDSGVDKEENDLGTLWVSGDWEGFYRLICFVSDLMNTNDKAFNKQNICQALRPELSFNTCIQYSFHLIFCKHGNRKLHSNLVDYVKSIGCKYEGILAKYS